MKRMYFLLAAFSCSFIAVGQITKTPTSFSQSGTTSWSTASSLNSAIESSNDVYLRSAIGSNQSSGILRLSGFGFNVPANATVAGVVVTIERHASVVNRVSDKSFRLLIDGTESGTTKTMAGKWSTVDTVVKYGTANDQWGNLYLTPAKLNSSAFGIAIQFQNGASPSEAFIDMVSVTVYYTNAPIVRFVGFDSKKQSSGLLLTWNVHEEDKITSYDVERSIDNVKFEKVGTVTAANKGEYNFLDPRPLTGKSFYRIRSLDMDLKTGYSTVITVNITEAPAALKAFPTFVYSKLTVQHEMATKGSLITITNLYGKQVRSIAPEKDSYETTVDLASLNPGIYVLHFVNEKGNVETLKIVKH